ncbi:MAG: alanine--tRNA ligase [Candidatus Goldbacteria bacterium]|nr:alanine--tRNA ligase [Candidatus Goldiibacteriota bacterium]
MNSNELRKLFLDFFAKKGHVIKPSSSLIPNERSILFTVAGMVPFKDYFLGKVPLTFTRAASVQKCIRTNDIENVGKTRRHHTFFEMLGNFSFGDYFKKDAIIWAWEFLTEVIKLPTSRMYVSIYKDDDEAFKIWKEKVKIPEDRIFRMGDETNFWQMGPVGPCGYCSEIYFDLEGGHKEKVTVKDIENNDDRFLEIWNLVFTQFNKLEDGSLVELKQKNIDTGMGLERLAAVSQAVYSNFETDLFMPIIKFISDKSEIKYGKDKKLDISLRVIADHCRGICFLICDGVIPSNEGRGYVLRRLIRRAARHGRILGLKDIFLHTTVPVVVNMMKEAYPELAQRKDYIIQMIKLEEEKFVNTMDNGLQILEDEIKNLKSKKVLNGEIAFKLYDTFGFPLEITEEILLENNISIDKEKFNELMEKQKEIAKQSWKGFNFERASKIPKEILQKFPNTVFKGYDVLIEEQAKIMAILQDGKKIETAKEGQEVEIILDITPFYAESGGQIGDNGEIISDNCKIEVIDTYKVDSLFFHKARVLKGEIKEGEKAKAIVNSDRRKSIMRNHTATHLLHSALRAILGLHVEQTGSYVGDDRLRFDFTHFSQLTDEEIKKVERLVNKWILENFSVSKVEMSFKEAKEKGAIALFEEKYGEKVRTVSIGDISMELCGGTHINYTGEIGIFKIISCTSVSAGVRRIEAITGSRAFDLLVALNDFVEGLKEQFKASDLADLGERINKLLYEKKELEKQIQKTIKSDLLKNVDQYIKTAREINGIKIITLKFDGVEKNVIRELGDIIKHKSKKSIIIFANIFKDKVSFLTMLTNDLTDKFDATEIIKAIAAKCGGGGGGRKDMAEAGGKDITKVDEALTLVDKIVMEK